MTLSCIPDSKGMKIERYKDPMMQAPLCSSETVVSGMTSFYTPFSGPHNLTSVHCFAIEFAKKQFSQQRPVEKLTKTPVGRCA